jgi:hypothetical protein
MAYDRLLERLYLVDEGWIIKGATALLARDIGVRGTLDIDLYREVAREIAGADLREAAAPGPWRNRLASQPSLHHRRRELCRRRRPCQAGLTSHAGWAA